MIWLLLSFIFCFYGISIGWKNSGTFFYCIWFFFGFISLILFIDSYYLFIPNVMKTGLKIVFFIGCIIGGYLFLLIFSKFHSKGIPDLDYLLVLGAQYKKSGPSNALRFRLEKANEYLQTNLNTKCIVSGGQGYNEPCTEAKGMKDFLVKLGVDSNRIIEEDKSTSTIENIQLSKEFIHNKARVGIVTNDFHLFRALSIAKKQGLNAYGIAAKSTLWYQPNNIFREMFGIIKDKLSKNM